MTIQIDQSVKTIRYDKHDNGSPVTRTPKGILIHSCEGTRTSSIPWLTTDPRSGVSCTYYVCRDGDVFQFAPDEYRTWHGGVGDWNGTQNLNDLIGIECEHKKGQDWPSVQLSALGELCRLLITRYTFPQSRIAAHRWAAKPQGRKQDPTDLTDTFLRGWINGLYVSPPPVDDRQAAWGSIPVDWAFGIPALWDKERKAGRPLGRAVTPEIYLTPDGYSVQCFERGSITFRVKDGRLAVGRFE